MKHLNKIVIALVCLLLCINLAHAQPAADLSLVGRAALVSRDGNNLYLGTEGADDIVIVQNDVVTFSIDGSTGRATFSGSLGDITTTGITSASSLPITVDSDAQRKFIFDASSDTAHTLIFGDSGTTAAQTLSILASTSDADDDSTVSVCSGGACSRTRGSNVKFYGNEVASVGGDIEMSTGDGANDTFYVYQGANNEFSVDATTVTITSNNLAVTAGTITSGRTTDLGWSVVAAANQACNTTCTSACVFGQETTSKAILACTDATADSCLCAGAS